MAADFSTQDLVEESVRRRFEAAWRAGTPVAIESVLPPADAPGYLPTLEELVHIELEFGWKGWKAPRGSDETTVARPPTLETYLLRFPRLEQPDILLRLVEQEYRVRQRYGDKPPLSDYQKRFPTLDLSAADLSLSAAPERTPHQEVTPEPGAPQVPGYEILGELGRGGMGVVYKARQVKLGRIVALKMILAGSHADAGSLARFSAEAEAVARLQHPNIVQIYEVGAHDGCPYFSLEFVAGGSLAQRLAGTPQPDRPAAELLQQLARAMDVAHQAGIIHRDLKPANILLASGERQSPGADDTKSPGDSRPPLASRVAKITDFGLAKRLDDDSGQTRTGDVLGTPSYMAPEQAAGKLELIGPATDVYALGAILYELLTGRAPFRGRSVFETLEQVRLAEPVPPSRLQPNVPHDLETICLKCLEKEGTRRYASAGALADDLGRFLAGEPVRARRTPLWERGWKLARRKPVHAGLLSALALAVALGVGLFVEKYRGALLEIATLQEREQTRDRVQNQILQAQQEIAAGQWGAALATLAEARSSVRDDPAAAELRRRIDTLHREATQAQAEQQARAAELAKLEQLDKARDDAAFHETSFTGKDLPTNVQAMTAAAADGLQLFGIRLGSPGTPQITEKYFTPEQGRQIVHGCFELLLAAAAAQAQPLPRMTVAEHRQRLEEALRLLDQAAALKVPSQALPFRRAAYLEGLGKNDEAVQVRKEAPAQPVAGALDHFRLGMEAYKANDPDQAAAHFDAVLRSQPQHFWAQYCLALCHRVASPERAEGNLSACIARRPDFAWLYVLRGHVRALLGEQLMRQAEQQKNKEMLKRALRLWREANADFDAALQSSPDELTRYGVFAERGLLRYHQKNFAEAVEDLKQAVALRPQQFQGHVTLAQAYLKQRQFNPALAALSKAILLEPRRADIYRTRAQVHLEREAWDAALGDFERAIALEPKGSNLAAVAADHAERGSLLARGKKFAEAVAAYDAALAARPDYLLAQRLRGVALVSLAETEEDPVRRQNHYQEAIRSLDEVVQRGDPDAAVYQARGLSRERLGDHTGAVDDYGRAIRLSPDVATYLKRGRLSLNALESPKLALRDFDTALKLGAESGDAYIGRGLCRALLGQYRDGVRDAEEALKRGSKAPLLLYEAARVYAQAVGRIDQEISGKPDRTLAELRVQYQDKAVLLVKQALAELPAGQRQSFWKDVVRGDSALGPIRRNALFVQLAAEFSKMEPGR